MQTSDKVTGEGRGVCRDVLLRKEVNMRRGLQQ